MLGSNSNRKRKKQRVVNMVSRSYLLSSLPPLWSAWYSLMVDEELQIDNEISQKHSRSLAWEAARESLASYNCSINLSRFSVTLRLLLVRCLSWILAQRKDQSSEFVAGVGKVTQTLTKRLSTALLFPISSKQRPTPLKKRSQLNQCSDLMRLVLELLQSRRKRWVDLSRVYCPSLGEKITYSRLLAQMIISFLLCFFRNRCSSFALIPVFRIRDRLWWRERGGCQTGHAQTNLRSEVSIV